MEYGFVETPCGQALVGLCENMICHISLGGDKFQELESLQQRFSHAQLQECESRIYLTDSSTAQGQLSLAVSGTDFQVSVWQQLLVIPRGTTCSYQDIANALGKPKAVRAVANAIARNNIAILIPCHRVIAKSGKLGGYRWGIKHKQTILTYESL